jgi:hypothetical protein
MKFCRVCEKYCRDDCPCFESHRDMTAYEQLGLEKENKK